MSYYMSVVILNSAEKLLKIFENQRFLLPKCRIICYLSAVKTYIMTGGGYEIALFEENVL